MGGAMIKRAGLWTALLVFPWTVNLFTWNQLSLPQLNQLKVWRERTSLTELKPKMEAAIEGARPLLIDWERTCFMKEDPSAAIQVIERLARQHRIEIKEIRANDQSAFGVKDSKQADSLPGFLALPVTVEAQGGFDALSRWVSELEGYPSLRIDTASFASGKASNQPHSLILHLTAYLSEGVGSLPKGRVSAKNYEDTTDQLSQVTKVFLQRKKERGAGYEVVFRRDPLRPLVDESGNVVNPVGLESSFELQGIVRSKDLNLALVNDRFLKEGDVIGPYKILQIRPDGIRAQRGAETLFIPLHSER